MLDAVVERYMGRDLSPEQIAEALTSRRCAGGTIQLNEYKRRQAHPGVRITPRRLAGLAISNNTVTGVSGPPAPMKKSKPS